MFWFVLEGQFLVNDHSIKSKKATYANLKFGLQY